MKKIQGFVVRGQANSKIELIGTIFMNTYRADTLRVNINGEYYHISLGKIKRLIKKQDNFWLQKTGQKKLNPQSNLLSVTAKIWRFVQ